MSAPPRTTPPRTVPGDSSRTDGRLSELRAVAAGAFAAGQALLLSLAVVVLPAVIASLAVADSADEGWSGALHVALGLWLLGHGVPWGVGGVTITLAPLGLTALSLVCCYLGAKRTAHATLGSWAAATGVYAAATFVLALVSRGAPGWWVLGAALGGVVVGGLGFGLGILARPASPAASDIAPGWLLRATDHGVGSGLRAGGAAFALVVAVAGMLVAVWAFEGRTVSADVAEALSPGLVGAVVLAIAQVALVPNLVLWGVSWLAGPGFAIGSGTVFSPSEQVLGPVPALPLLGALPGDTWVGGVWVWAPAVVVLAGVLAGTMVWRSQRVLSDAAAGLPSLGSLVAGSLTAGVTAGAVTGLLLLLGSGAVGPGTMSDVGADPLLVGGLVAGEVAAGALLVVGVLLARARWRTRADRADERWHDVADDETAG